MCIRDRAGLIDLYKLAGIRKAGKIAEGIGEWVYGRLNALTHEQRVKMWSIYIAGEYGGMNESMAELFRITGKKEFLEAARFFDNDRLFYPLEQGVDALDGMHANQHIPQVIGAVKMYEMTGEKRYYGLASLFWKIVTPVSYTHLCMSVACCSLNAGQAAASVCVRYFGRSVSIVSDWGTEYNHI